MSKLNPLLLDKITTKQPEIAEFFRKKFSEFPPLFYNSVDIRNSGFKIAPVDTNCYPASFNNFSENSKRLSAQLVDDFFLDVESKSGKEIRKVVIIPENHTRNFNYLRNVLHLQQIISTKREVLIGSLLPELTENTTIDLEDGNFLTLHPLVKQENRILTIDGFSPDFLVLNNDLTTGIPEILNDITTPISPSPALGWHSRTKSHHFTIYNRLAEELSSILEIDPWIISSLHRFCEDIDFKEPDKEVGGIKCLAKYVDELLTVLQKKYQEHGIDDKPYCYVKADNGTYGMAVWPVFSGEEVLEINRKERNKMNMLKGSVQNTRVMIQEGIRTIDMVDDKVAEPMIYLVNGQVSANLFRVNENRDNESNLNSAGAIFFDLENLTDSQVKIGVEKNKVIEVYSLLARLAALAASVENHELQNKTGK